MREATYKENISNHTLLLISIHNKKKKDENCAQVYWKNDWYVCRYMVASYACMNTYGSMQTWGKIYKLNVESTIVEIYWKREWKWVKRTDLTRS